VRKTTIIVCLSLSALIILGQFKLWDSLLMFVLMGAIPGTTMSIPPLAMLVGMSLLTLTVMIILLVPQNADGTQAHKKTLPKKRYSRV
jgi:TRAP-type C4-dicarboxylate transport system permease small subunit